MLSTKDTILLLFENIYQGNPQDQLIMSWRLLFTRPHIRNPTSQHRLPFLKNEFFILQTAVWTVLLTWYTPSNIARLTLCPSQGNGIISIRGNNLTQNKYRPRPYSYKLCISLHVISRLTKGIAYGDSLVKGVRGVDLPEILHRYFFFLLALAEFSPLFCPNLGGQLPPPPPGPLALTPMPMVSAPSSSRPVK